MKYFPFFRGKQNELLALKSLASKIAESEKIIPIVEPVNWNSTTQGAIREFLDSAMRFLLICNPAKGEFSADHAGLTKKIVESGLMSSRDWTPALRVDTATQAGEVKRFREKYSSFRVAFIYDGRPRRSTALDQIQKARVAHHVFMGNRVDRDYVHSIPAKKRVIIEERFRRQARNAEYPDIELFTDRNTRAGNPRDIDFGDFSIVGDYYTKTGGPAHAVALHHVHFDRNSSMLLVTHFKSDRRHAAVDTSGKTFEALDHLVTGLRRRRPSNTSACREYRELHAVQRFRGLGYMKRLAIKHHLEVILHPKGFGN